VISSKKKKKKKKKKKGKKERKAAAMVGLLRAPTSRCQVSRIKGGKIVAEIDELMGLWPVRS
jgi:hypothetical protein